MDAFQQDLQLFTEDGIIVWTSESSLVSEVPERDSADRAGGVVQSAQLFCGVADDLLRELLSERGGHSSDRARIVVSGFVEIFACVFFAQMDFNGRGAGQFGDMKSRGTIAFLALHWIPLEFWKYFS